MTPARVILVGVGGYGKVHLRHLIEFHGNGEIVLAAAVVLPSEQDGAEARSLRALGCTLFDTIEPACAAARTLSLDLAIVPTPIHCHAPMTLALLAAGLHVLVEKPIAATLDEVAAIAAAARQAHRVVAVGFQYLHAPEVGALKHHLLAGTIGAPRRIVTHGAWPRGHAYYQRNDWAGRLHVNGGCVLDSPVNNAMSHFVMLMLFLAGARPDDAADPVRVTAQLLRAQAIESFDTAVLHIETREGVRLDFYGTHSSEHISRPRLRIIGERGIGEWVQDDHAKLAADDGASPWWSQSASPEFDTRERMLRDVLAKIAGKPSFVCSPALAAAHTRIVAAIHRSAPIHEIAPTARAERIEDDQPFTYVPGLDAALAAAWPHGAFLDDKRWPGAPTIAPVGPAFPG